MATLEEFYTTSLWPATEVVTTALMKEVQGFKFKSSKFNPWAADQPCPKTLSGATPSAQNESLPSVAKKRARSMEPKNLTTNRNDTSSVVTLAGHTFTSPSIYIKFQTLQASDECGPIGLTDLITSTIVAFDPGELSTFIGSNYDGNGNLSAFNVTDLPCPPQSAMEANWYKPQPGEPYIPRFAFPTKLKALDPLWGSCKAMFFTAYDPPRALVPVSAVDPQTTADPSSSYRNEGSTPAAVETPAPVSTPGLHQPEQTAAPLFNPGFLDGDPGLANPSPTHDSTSEPSVGAASTAHIVQPETSGSKSKNNPGSGLPKVLLDPFNMIGIPSTSHANALESENNRPKITNVVGDDATFLPDAIAIGDSTLGKGNSPLTVSGTVVSLASTAIVIGSKTLPLPHTQQVVTTIAGSPLIYHPHAVAIAGNTLKPGSSPETLSEAVVALDSSGLILVPKPLALPQTERIVTAVAGQEITLLPHAIAFDGTTLTPGASPFTLAGITMTLGPPSLLMGTQVIPFDQLDHVTTSPSEEHPSTSNPRPNSADRPRPSISINSDGKFVIGGSKLSPGAAGITVHGDSISVAPNRHLVLAGTTLLPGRDDTTIDGTLVSVATDGDLVVNGATLHAGSGGVPLGSTPISVASEGLLAIDGTTLTPGGRGATLSDLLVSVALNSNLVLDGTTLTPGGAVVTIDGRLISVASDGNLVIGGTTLGPGAISGAAGSTDGAIRTPTASNNGLGPLFVGASPTGIPTTSVALEGKAAVSRTKASSWITVILVMLIGTWMS